MSISKADQPDLQTPFSFSVSSNALGNASTTLSMLMEQHEPSNATFTLMEHENNALKLQLKTKEQSWSKDKAILEQKIELLESHIYESRIRQENLQKMNDAFMTALQDLTSNPKNFSNKILKDLQQLFEGRGTCSEHEQQLTKQAATIKDQRNEIEELKAKIYALEEELAEKEAMQEEQSDQLRRLYQHEIQNLQAQHAQELEEDGMSGQAAHEIDRLKNLIDTMNENHKMEIEMIQSQKQNEAEENANIQMENMNNQIQQLQQQCQQQQQILAQQQIQYNQKVQQLEGEKNQLNEQIQTVVSKLESTQDQNNSIQQAFQQTQNQVEELKYRLIHGPTSFPNTCSDFFDAELGISRIEPDRAKRRSMVNESLLSNLNQAQIPNNVIPQQNNGNNQNGSNNDTFCNSTYSNQNNQDMNQHNNSNGYSSPNNNIIPNGQQEMRITELQSQQKHHNNGLTRSGSMCGSELSNCDTFGYPSGVKGKKLGNNIVSASQQGNDLAPPSVSGRNSRINQANSNNSSNSNNNNNNTNMEYSQQQQQQQLSQQQILQEKQKLQLQQQQAQQSIQMQLQQQQQQLQFQQLQQYQQQQYIQQQQRIIETSMEKRNALAGQIVQKKSKCSQDLSDSQQSIQNMKTEDTTSRKDKNPISSGYHNNGSLSCTNLQAFSKPQNGSIIAIKPFQDQSNQHSLLSKVTKNSISSTPNNISYNSNQLPSQKYAYNNSIRNSSCNPQKVSSQENYPQPMRAGNSFMQGKMQKPMQFEQSTANNNNNNNNTNNNNNNNNKSNNNPNDNSQFMNTSCMVTAPTSNNSVQTISNNQANILSQSMVSGVSQSIISNANVSQSVSMGRANTSINPMSQSSLLNQDQSFLLRAIQENMNERTTLEEKMKNLESEVSNYISLSHPKSKVALPDSQLVQQVMKELYAKQINKSIFGLAKEEKEALLKAEIKILVDKVLSRPVQTRPHSQENKSILLNSSINKSLALDETGIRESKSPRYNHSLASSNVLHSSTILAAKGNVMKQSTNIFGRIQVKPSSATHFQQQLQGLQGQHFFDKKIHPQNVGPSNNRN